MLGTGNRRRIKSQLYLAWVGFLLMALCFVWLQFLVPPRKSEPKVQTPPVPKSFALVVLDPGHGGQDSGTIKGDLIEKDLTLDVAQRVDRLLQLRGVNTMFTRNDDTYVSLADRAAIANGQNDCVFVSIHFDAAKPTATGIETYYAVHQVSSLSFLQPLSLDSLNVESQSLAKFVQDALVTRTQAINRGTSAQQFFVIANVLHPAILVEGGFLTNADDMNKIGAEYYRDQLANAITDGVMRYREILEQRQTPLVVNLPDTTK